MYTLIDKLTPVSTVTNVPTVGYQTLFCVAGNIGGEAVNYNGTEAEAQAIKATLTVTMSDQGVGAGRVTNVLDGQYIQVRTIAGTKTAFIEIVLTSAYVVSAVSSDSNLKISSAYLTLPSNSQV